MTGRTVEMKFSQNTLEDVRMLMENKTSIKVTDSVKGKDSRCSGPLLIHRHVMGHRSSGTSENTYLNTSVPCVVLLKEEWSTLNTCEMVAFPMEGMLSQKKKNPHTHMGVKFDRFSTIKCKPSP